MKTLAERFWAKVDVRGPDECWPWLASTNEKGYGRIGFGGTNGKQVRAHRLAYHLAHPEWSLDSPDEVCHSCDNKPCCNEAHLFPGTHDVNMADMVKKGRGRSFRGEENRSSKLTEAAVLIAWDLRGQFPRWMIAKVLGVSQTNIGSIHRGNTWAWLTGANL